MSLSDKPVIDAFSNDIESTNPHRAPVTSPLAMLRSIWQNRKLLVQLVHREVVSRYRGSVIGLAWSFFNPLLMLLVYTFVFSVVFKARWGVATEGKASFAIFLFAGLLVHGVFAECIMRAPSLIIANTNYVKRVVFPLEILPAVAMGSAIFHALVGLLVLFVAQGFSFGLQTTAVLFPLILVPLIFATLGVAWVLAAIGVYIRDISYITQIISTVMLFMSPVFYPIEAMPEEYRAWMYINPLTFIIEQSRAVLILGDMPHWSGLGLYTATSMLLAWLGYWCFQRMRGGFADVL
jgi:lipopolysaccharide transport system permease protein